MVQEAKEELAQVEQGNIFQAASENKEEENNKEE